MKCLTCHAAIEKSWEFCARCGARLQKESVARTFFDNVFSGMDREMREMDRRFSRMEKEFQAFDLSPMFRNPAMSGFTIKVSRSSGRPPQVSVRTFGNVDKGQLQKAVQQQFGVSQPVAESPYAEDVRKRAKQIEREESTKTEREQKFDAIRSAEEPHTRVWRSNGRVHVDLELPGVRSMDDIEIKELESSVEVKAVGGKKGYFKILTKPPQFRLADTRLERGILQLAFS